MDFHEALDRVASITLRVEEHTGVKKRPRVFEIARESLGSRIECSGDCHSGGLDISQQIMDIVRHRDHRSTFQGPCGGYQRTTAGREPCGHWFVVNAEIKYR